MLALAAISCCSAWRMSGRLHQQLGRQARSGLQLGQRSGHCIAGGAQSPGQRLPQQQDQRVFIQRALALLLGQRGRAACASDSAWR
jgi:hypothetical protein